MSLDYRYFKEKMLELTGFDLHGYKEKQIRRRLKAPDEVPGGGGFSGLLPDSKRNPAPEAIFSKEPPSTSQNFSATPSASKNCRRSTCRSYWPQELPRSLECGASPGRSLYPGHHFLRTGLRCARASLATDVDEEALQFARQGIYPRGASATSPGIPAEYFRAVRKTIRSWTRSSLVSFKGTISYEDPFPSGFDLILCRNVDLFYPGGWKKSTGALPRPKPQWYYFYRGHGTSSQPRPGPGQPLPFFYQKKAAPVGVPPGPQSNKSSDTVTGS